MKLDPQSDHPPFERGVQLIISKDDHGRQPDDSRVFKLLSQDRGFELSVLVAQPLFDDFRNFLGEHGFQVIEVDESARAVWEEAVVAAASNPAAWAAAGSALIAFIRRHRGKAHRIEIEGRTISVEGYSSREAKRLAKEILEWSRDAQGDLAIRRPQPRSRK